MEAIFTLLFQSDGKGKYFLFIIQNIFKIFLVFIKIFFNSAFKFIFFAEICAFSSKK